MPKTSKKHGQEVGGRKTRSLKPSEPSWQIQTAKARFSEVFRTTLTECPQLITRQGKEGVVMISGEQYEQLVGKSHQPKSILLFFRESPRSRVYLYTALFRP